MLDRSECKKPEKRYSFRGVRSSKFRHVFGQPAKREKCYENIRLTRTAQDTNICAVNPKFLAVVEEVGGGGSFLVLPLSQSGRVARHWAGRVTGHAGPVLELRWSPFNDNLIASSSEDCSVKVWYIPDGSLTEIKESLVTLSAHKKKVSLISWHPVADNIIASVGYDNLIIIWNVSKAVPVSFISCHPDTIFSISWNRSGSLLATTCKDKQVRVVEPRSGRLVRQGGGHQGAKPARCVWLGDKGIILTTGFSKHSERQVGLWSQSDLSHCLHLETIDSSSGVLMPVYDADTSMVYLAGRGDGNIRYYEVMAESPWLSYLNQYVSGTPQRSLAVLPKRGVDVMSCEILRFYKVHRDLVEPISMIVPRKTDVFQDDIYTETNAPIPALSEEEWISGTDAAPVQISMRTGANIKTFKPVMFKPSEAAIVVSERNNDRKFMFLSEETNPDYRPRTAGQAHSDSAPDKTKSKPSEQRTWEGTLSKFERVQKKWTNGSVRSVCLNLDLDEIYRPAIPTGASSVMDLTQRFSEEKVDSADKENSGLKRVVSDQFRRINSLHYDVRTKEKKIQQLESRLAVMSCSNTPLGEPISHTQWTDFQ